MEFANIPQQVFPLNRINLSDLPAGNELWNYCKGFYPSDVGAYKCVRPTKSFWFSQGANDPLEFIYIFKNAGGANQDAASRHWHYIGFGLSDIFCYSLRERLRDWDLEYKKMNKPLPELYPPSPPGVKMNGFGFELTARIKCNSDEEWNSEPPLWPQRLLQDLARYVFKSRNTFGVGDHVANIVDDDRHHNHHHDGSSSRIEHILMTLDPELNQLDTTMGPVRFIQIVGVCQEELEAARQWSGRGILDMMKEHQETGGPLLITDMSRDKTIFELEPQKYNQLRDVIERYGSDMAQISNRHKTSHVKPDWFIRVECGNYGAIEDDRRTLNVAQIESDTSVKAEPGIYQPPVRTPSRMSIGSESALKIENADFYDVRYYDQVYILLSLESARVLPVMLEGRLKHRRAFSFQSFKGDSLITFQPEGCTSPLTSQSKVSAERPFAQHLHWLQIYVPDTLRDEMYESIKLDLETGAREQLKLPKNYSWPEFNLHLTIVDEIWEA